MKWTPTRRAVDNTDVVFRVVGKPASIAHTHTHTTTRGAVGQSSLPNTCVSKTKAFQNIHPPSMKLIVPAMLKRATRKETVVLCELYILKNNINRNAYPRTTLAHNTHTLHTEQFLDKCQWEGNMRARFLKMSNRLWQRTVGQYLHQLDKKI